MTKLSYSSKYDGIIQVNYWQLFLAHANCQAIPGSTCESNSCPEPEGKTLKVQTNYQYEQFTSESEKPLV